MESVHDIGKYRCDFCTNNRNSSILFTDAQGKHKICKKCYRKASGKESRAETQWSEYVDKHFGTEYLTSSDKSLKSQGGCQLYRPDKLYIAPDFVFIDECDEKQHSYHNGDYDCDEKRISDICEEEGISGKKVAVIRWNPDHYKTPDGSKKKTRTERLKEFVELKRKIMKEQTDLIHVYYMYYNEDNPLLTKNFPKTMIY